MLVEFSNKDVLELEQAGGNGPLAVTLAAVMLERQASRAGKSGIVAPGRTVLPFSATVTVLPRTVISK